MQAEHLNPDESANGPEGTAAAASLKEQLEAALSERDANYERFLRSQAEFDNYRKRAQREADEDRKFAVIPIVRDLLPALDNLRRGVDAARPVAEAANLVHGIDLVLQQVEQTLAKYGVMPIPSAGEAFDPHLHEALTQMPSAEHPPLTVLQELERGYKLHDRVVRPSKVIVSQAAQ
ncbi:MAG: nucleotide exchange factor GrpE [Planctomycetaceae bacterium]|nr:nucleotide exchange factor GrpE [Planctomycetaceae bacterium]